MPTTTRRIQRVSAVFSIALLGLFAASPALAAEVMVGTPDPIVKFTNGGVGLLVSQIGYALPGVRVAYLVAQNKAAGDALCRYTIEDASGKTLY
ncbi:MAG TPA: hypothetical protein VGC79_15195, partial [Polyangiaceae bacterium]